MSLGKNKFINQTNKKSFKVMKILIYRKILDMNKTKYLETIIKILIKICKKKYS